MLAEPTRDNCENTKSLVFRFWTTLALIIAVTIPAKSELSAGVARVNLTPDTTSEEVPLGGYTARGNKKATGVRDEVNATALVLKDGNRRIAIVSCDLVTIPASLSEAVAQRLPGWSEYEVLLCATHTHCAPDSQRLNRRMRLPVPGIATFDQRALEWTADRIATAIVEALRETQQVTIWIESVEAGLSRRRRASSSSNPSPRGYAFRPWPESVRAKRVPPEEPDRMTVLELRRLDGSPLASIVHYAAHPTIFDERMMLISAEWPGELVRCWERRHSNAKMLFLNGAMGDRSPVAEQGKDDDERVSLYARALLQRVEAARSTMRPTSRNTFQLGYATALLPEPVAHTELVQRMSAQGVPKGFVSGYVQGFAATSALVRWVRLGDLRILFVPGEPTTEAGSRLADAVGCDLVVSFAGEWVGYILTPEEYRRGGYEATVSFHGPMLLDAIISAARRARSVALGPEAFVTSSPCRRNTAARWHRARALKQVVYQRAD